MKTNTEEITLKFFPWEYDIPPDFVNEEGFEWYLDEITNQWLAKDMRNGVKGIKNMRCFFVRKNGIVITRVLIDDKQNIIYEHTNWELMLSHIDILKLAKSK